MASGERHATHASAVTGGEGSATNIIGISLASHIASQSPPALRPNCINSMRTADVVDMKDTEDEDDMTRTMGWLPRPGAALPSRAAAGAGGGGHRRGPAASEAAPLPAALRRCGGVTGGIWGPWEGMGRCTTW